MVYSIQGHSTAQSIILSPLWFYDRINLRLLNLAVVEIIQIFLSRLYRIQSYRLL